MACAHADVTCTCTCTCCACACACMYVHVRACACTAVPGDQPRKRQKREGGSGEKEREDSSRNTTAQRYPLRASSWVFPARPHTSRGQGCRRAVARRSWKASPSRHRRSARHARPIPSKAPSSPPARRGSRQGNSCARCARLAPSRHAAPPRLIRPCVARSIATRASRCSSCRSAPATTSPSTGPSPTRTASRPCLPSCKATLTTSGAAGSSAARCDTL
jgi:hypothetical protein